MLEEWRRLRRQELWLLPVWRVLEQLAVVTVAEQVQEARLGLQIEVAQ